MLRSKGRGSGLPTTSTAASAGPYVSPSSYGNEYSNIGHSYSSSSSSSFSSKSDCYNSAPSYGNNTDYYSHYGGSSSSNIGEYKDKPVASQFDQHKRSLLKIVQKPWVVAGLAVLAFFSLSCKYRSQYNYLLKELHAESVVQALDAFESLETSKLKLSRDLAKKQQMYEKRLINLEVSHDKTKKERDDLKQKLDATPVSRDSAWVSQVVRLQHVISQEARRSVIEKYGFGPHRVRMFVKFPNENIEKSFVIELASEDLLPHAVHVFLEQVDYNLWERTWFYLNGPHVLQAGPQVEYAEDEDYMSEEEERERALGPFIEAGLEALAYPEYSVNFPHDEWTVGFAGRPGGPDFYINKINNTESHGPGGQAQYELGEYADACFGKIVEGMDVIAQLVSLEVITDDPDWKWFLDEPVMITRAEIIGYHHDTNATAAHPSMTTPVQTTSNRGHEESQQKAYLPPSHQQQASPHQIEEHQEGSQQHHHQPHHGDVHFHKPHVAHQVTP